LYYAGAVIFELKAIGTTPTSLEQSGLNLMGEQSLDFTSSMVEMMSCCNICTRWLGILPGLNNTYDRVDSGRESAPSRKQNFSSEWRDPTSVYRRSRGHCLYHGHGGAYQWDYASLPL